MTEPLRTPRAGKMPGAPGLQHAGAGRSASEDEAVTVFDWFAATPTVTSPPPPEGRPPVDLWAATQLSAPHVEPLAALERPVTLYLDGVGEVLFCHGTPRDDNEVVPVDTLVSNSIGVNRPRAVCRRRRWW